MRDFNQAALDEQLAAMASNLDPEQVAQFQQRVKERALQSDVTLTADGINGAAELLGVAARGGFQLPGMPSTERLSGLLDHLNLPDVPLGGLGDLAGSLLGTARDGIGGVLGGAMHLLGKSGDVVAGAGSVASGAIDLAGSAGGTLADVAGNAGEVLSGAGDVAGVILGALGDVLGGLDF